RSVARPRSPRELGLRRRWCPAKTLWRKIRCNPGVMVWNKFVRIGLLPGSKRGMHDITEQYVAKFGPPPVGRKIFIRVQQMNDYLGSVVQTTSAIVPKEEGWDDA
ncbi:MAG: hypothetical protein NT154_19335, partial [Verrucomicrobia bacterium]|nr:hypothetical protein [Verrucomicrobiota bacterium]